MDVHIRTGSCACLGCIRLEQALERLIPVGPVLTGMESKSRSRPVIAAPRMIALHPDFRRDENPGFAWMQRINPPCAGPTSPALRSLFLCWHKPSCKGRERRPNPSAGSFVPRAILRFAEAMSEGGIPECDSDVLSLPVSCFRRFSGALTRTRRIGSAAPAAPARGRSSQPS